MKIPITRPLFDQQELDLVQEPLRSGWLVQGPFVQQFEDLFARFTGAPFARASSNCTTALHLALGIGAGDRVLVPAFTYVASANAVEYTGAQVVFCDIDLATFNLDLGKARRILAEDRARTIKAIMPVHLFGLCADMEGVLALAREFGLKVVEDAACGFGARIGDRHAGTFGEAGCFSFHPRKSITTGEGGMLVTADEALAVLVGSLRDHGAGKSDLLRHQEQGGSLLPDFAVRGYNYRMTDLQGAIGVAQMGKGQAILDARARAAARYDRLLADIPFLKTPVTPPGFTHGYQSYVCLYTGGEDLSRPSPAQVERLNQRRNRLMGRLEEAGIATRQGTHAVPSLSYYRERCGLREEDYLQAFCADRLSIALPLFATLTLGESAYVAEQIQALGGD